MNRSKLVPVFLALLLVSLSGCGALGGGESTPESSEAAQRLQQQSVDAMESVESYRMDLSMDVESESGSVTIDSDALIDRSERKMRMNMTISGAGMHEELVMFIEDRTAYIDTGMMWQTQTYDYDVWSQQDRIAQQRELLNHSRVTLAGNDTVDGEPVRVMEIHPDEDKLKEIVAQQPSSNYGNAEFESVQYTFYVSSETQRLRKMEMDASMTVDGNSGDVSITMTISDYGTNATVDIPPEATGSTSA